MSLASAFNLVLSIHAKNMTILRKGAPDITATVMVAPSNYFRNLEGPSETVIPGREFVLSKASLDSGSYPKPIRGDRLVDVELGTLVISEVREMFDLGSSVIGYRVRTS